MIGLTSTPTAPELHRQAQRSAAFIRKLAKSNRTCKGTCMTALKITLSFLKGILKQQCTDTSHKCSTKARHFTMSTYIATKEQQTLQRTTLNGHGPLRSVPEVGADDLTHPNVPKAALSQLSLQQESFPGHFPSIPPKAHGEGGGVGTGHGQVIAQSVIAAC